MHSLPIMFAMQEYPEKPSFYQKHLPWFNWSVATFFCIFQFFLQASASVMAKEWMQDFHLDTVGVSKLSAIFFYAYVIMQIPVGFLNDRFNPRRILTLAAFLVAAGCISFAHTNNTTVAYIDRVLMGVGSSFGFVSMLYICSRWFQANRFAFMVSISESVGMVGVALVTLLSAWLLTKLGWRQTMYTSGVVAAILMVAAHILVRDKPIAVNTEKKPLSIWKSLRIATRKPQLWLANIYGFFAFAIINAITSLWGVPFLNHNYHLSISTATAIIGMKIYGLEIGLPIVGWISTRLGQRKPVLLVGSSFTTLLLSIAIFVPHLPIWLLFVLFFLTGVTGSSYVHCFSISKEKTPAAINGVSLAVTNMVMMLGAPIMQIAIGYLLSHQFFGLSHSPALTYRLAIGLVPAGIALSFFIALGFKEKRL